ncbi:hypothetical protein D3C86_1699100 [compost metagenome]
MTASPAFISSCSSETGSPCEASSATPEMVRQKPAIWPNSTRVRNRMKFSTKITMGMPAWMTAALMAEVCCRAV